MILWDISIGIFKRPLLTWSEFVARPLEWPSGRQRHPPRFHPDSILKNKSGFSELRKNSRMIKLPNSSSILVGGWTNPSEKYARQNGLIFPKVRDENQKCLKPPPTKYCLVASDNRSKVCSISAKSLRTGSHPRCVEGQVWMSFYRMQSGCPKINLPCDFWGFWAAKKKLLILSENTKNPSKASNMASFWVSTLNFRWKIPVWYLP